MIGEDIGLVGGLFRATEGLYERFGSERIRDTPLTESGFVGCAIGAALTGLRPVVELQFSDFSAVAFDQIVNQAAKLRFMMGGTPKLPLVIRMVGGGGVRLGAQHSQSLEALFAHIPGLVVAMPSSPFDAKGLLAAAIADDNPVIFLEQKLLFFGEPAPVPEERYAISLGEARVVRPGTDVTVVALGALVPHALRAARELEADGVSVEVLDPRTLVPLDVDAIAASVAKTSRVVVAHEAVRFGGFGAEIAAHVAEHCFWDLDAPVVRVGAPSHPDAVPEGPRAADAAGRGRDRRGRALARLTAHARTAGRVRRSRHERETGRPHARRRAPARRARGGRIHRRPSDRPRPHARGLPGGLPRRPRGRVRRLRRRLGLRRAVRRGAPPTEPADHVRVRGAMADGAGNRVSSLRKERLQPPLPLTPGFGKPPEAGNARRTATEGGFMATTDIWTYRETDWTTSNFVGYGVEALDGSIGKIDEATIDAGSSYMVIDTGPWIFGKKVMLPAGVIGRVDHEDEKVYVNRTKDQIKDAPEFDEDRYRDDAIPRRAGLLLRHWRSRLPRVVS